MNRHTNKHLLPYKVSNGMYLSSLMLSARVSQVDGTSVQRTLDGVHSTFAHSQQVSNVHIFHCIVLYCMFFDCCKKLQNHTLYKIYEINDINIITKDTK